MGTSDFRLDAVDDIAGTTVRLVGELDITSADDVHRGLRSAAESGGILRLDLSEVQFVDSSGLGALVKLHNAAGEHGTSLRLVRVPDRVRRLLDITNLSDVFAIDPA